MNEKTATDSDEGHEGEATLLASRGIDAEIYRDAWPRDSAEFAAAEERRLQSLKWVLDNGSL